MAVMARLVAVGTTATQLSPVQSDHRAGLSVAVKNTGSVDVFLGGADVTTAQGFLLAAGESLALDLTEAGYGAADASKDEALYAIAGSATSVRVIASGV